MTEPANPAAASAGSVTLYDTKTNAPVVVSAEDAPGHILGGRLNYAPGTRVPVRVDGKIGTVDADELGDAVSKYGAKPVTGPEFHAHQQQEKYGSTQQAALAFGVNALDSATIGGSNAIIGGLGGKDTREYLRGITEANPAAATAGDVAGFVAPVAADVLSGGTLTPGIAAAEAARVAARAGGTAAERMAAHAALRAAEEVGGAGLLRAGADTAVSALRGPTRAVSAVGDVAEGAVKALIGSNAEGATARFAQNIIAGGARGIAEGGIYGVGQEVGHQYLQDNPELSGEALGSAWWHGAMAGGLLGGALHGVGGMLTKKAPALERAMLEEGDKGAAAAAKESVVADTAAKAIIGQVDDQATKAVLQDAWKNRATAFAKHDDLLVDATRKITDDLNETLKAGHAVDMASFGESKSNQMAKLVPAENLKPARAAALSVWNDATNVIAELESQAAKGGQEGSVKRLGKWLKDFGKVPTEEWRDPAALFDKLDSFKRNVGKEAGFGTSPFGRSEASRDFEALYDRIKGALEDESTWGAAAVAQREVNAATSEMLGTSRRFESGYTTRYGDKGGVPQYVADPAKIDSFVNSLTKPANDLNAQMFSDRIAGRRNFLDAVEKNYSFPPEVKAAIASERIALDSMGKTIEKTGSEVSSINQLKRIMADEKGHGVHGLIGMAIDMVTKPGLSLARLAELEATKNRALAKIEEGLAAVKSALKGSGDRRKPGLVPKTPDSPDTYEKRRATVIAAASKPEDLHANLQGASAPVGPSAPATAQAMQRAGLRTVQYLMTELPKPPPRPGSLTPQLDAEQWQASDQQKAQFNRKFDAATHPTFLLDYVANGTITAQHVEAIKATRPAIYADMSQKLDAELKAQKKPVPFHLQGPIKTFLGLPQMDPQLQKLMQSNYAAPAQRAQGPKRPMKMADTTTLNATKERL